MTEPAVPRIRFGWRAAATLALTLVVLVFLVHGFGGTGDFVAAVRRARPSWVGVAFAAATACVWLTTVRWQLVLGGMGHALGFRRALEVVLASWPLGLVMPSRANDLLRAVAVRDVVPLAVGTGSILAEKAIDLLVLLAYAAIGAAFFGLWPLGALLAAALVAEIVVLALVVTRRGWLESLPWLRTRPRVVEELFGALTSLRRSPMRLASIAGVSLVIRVLTVAVTHALLIAVGADVTLLQTLLLWPTAIIAGIAPLTLGGMGTRDAMFIALVSAHGAHVDASAVLAATMGYSAVAMWSFAIVGLPFMVRETLSFRRA
jgi:glycosyltransferase 2 family protein